MNKGIFILIFFHIPSLIEISIPYLIRNKYAMSPTKLNIKNIKKKNT